jgi:hypothetical protein
MEPVCSLVGTGVVGVAVRKNQYATPLNLC